MFNEQFDRISIRTAEIKKRGLCLEALCGETAVPIDFCGDQSRVSEGTSAYFFGNTLIVVTRWAGMSKRERQLVSAAPMVLVQHMTTLPQFSLRIGDNWSDVIITLPHCLLILNDEATPVGEAVFLFSDICDSEFLVCRRVALPEQMQRSLLMANRVYHRVIHLDGLAPALKKRADEDPSHDFWDYLYDSAWEPQRRPSRIARGLDPENSPSALYMTIEGGRAVRLFRNEAPDNTVD